jgi:Fic family protein
VKVLLKPMLYLSLYFKPHRQHYPELLDSICRTGDWEAWHDFFGEAVIVTATQAVDTARQLLELAQRDREKIRALGRVAGSTHAVHQELLEHPIASSAWLVQKIGQTPATINKVLVHLERLGIVEELTAKKRNRLLSSGYVEVINRGTELPRK